MSKPKAPKAPDYAAAAREQGVANVNSAIATNFLNQADQVGPYGSMTYSYDYDNAYVLPDGTRIPRTTATTTLSADQQKLLDQNTAMSTQMNDLAMKGLGYVDDTISRPVDQTGMPSLTGGLGAPPNVTGTYDFSSLGALPNAADFNATRDKVTDAYMERLQPYLDRERAGMDTRLANQGITRGSEAWGWDQDVFNRKANDQRITALLAGDQAAQNLFNNSMQARQQGANEIMSKGSFENLAQQQRFNQGLASAEFGNQARSQAIQEADYFKNQPLNMLNALRTGNQVNMPSFGNVTAGAGIAAAPVYQATADQYQAALQKYQMQMQANSGLLGGLSSMGSAAILASDRRLKKNIQPIGLRADGLMLYSYDYIWGEGPTVGVMADEVAALRPEALGPTIAGFATVNYGAL